MNYQQLFVLILFSLLCWNRTLFLYRGIITTEVLYYYMYLVHHQLFSHHNADTGSIKELLHFLCSENISISL